MKRLEKAYAKLLHEPLPLVVTSETRFLCDEGLGGLARWLRVYGYSAAWARGLKDAEILRWAEREGFFFLTTDTLLMDMKLLRDRLIPVLWVPPSIRKREQFQWVREKLKLSRQDSRCMECNGELREVSKDRVLDRIPPKTRVWIDEYWECENCHKLFWEGTHWEKISTEFGSETG